MIKWIHHLLNPHCPDCKEERDEARTCISCEKLTYQLDVANHQIKELVKTITDMSRPALADNRSQPPIPQAVTPPPNWRVIRQQLEAEDRKTAALLREKTKEQEVLAKQAARGESGGIAADITQLEKELGVENG